MNGHDAFEEEMLFRTLTDGATEQLLRGRAPEGSEFVEVAEFVQTVGQTLPACPKDGSALVRQLAEAARTASPKGAIKTTPIAVPASATRFRLQPSRLVAVARATAVLALVPLVFAGLAVAGVSLPEPARNAFEVVGVDLPNQPADDGQESEPSGGAGAEPRGDGDGGGDVSRASGQKATKEKGPGAKADERGHGTEKVNPAEAGGRTNGEQGRGRALGKRGLAPGQSVPPGQLKKGEDAKAGDRTNAAPSKSSKPSAPPANGKPAAKGTPESGGGGVGSKPPIKTPKG